MVDTMIGISAVPTLDASKDSPTTVSWGALKQDLLAFPSPAMSKPQAPSAAALESTLSSGPSSANRPLGNGKATFGQSTFGLKKSSLSSSQIFSFQAELSKFPLEDLLSATLNRVRADNAQLQSMQDELKKSNAQQLHSMQDALQISNARQLHSMQNELKKSNAQQLQSMRDEHTALKAEATQQCQIMQDEIGQIRQQYQSLQNKYNQMRQQLQTVENENDQLQQEATVLTGRLGDLEWELRKKAVSGPASFTGSFSDDQDEDESDNGSSDCGDEGDRDNGISDHDYTDDDGSSVPEYEDDEDYFDGTNAPNGPVPHVHTSSSNNTPNDSYISAPANPSSPNGTAVEHKRITEHGEEHAQAEAGLESNEGDPAQQAQPQVPQHSSHAPALILHKRKAVRDPVTDSDYSSVQTALHRRKKMKLDHSNPIERPSGTCSKHPKSACW